MRDPMGRYASSLDAPGVLYRPLAFGAEPFDEFAQDMDAWLADRARLKAEEEAAWKRMEAAITRLGELTKGADDGR